MYQTRIGLFDGNSWERFCQICLKLKYQDEGYQEVVASPGDYGIEGFTRSGKVFQCYCPDFNCGGTELYAKQRDKVTTDLKKLVQFKTGIGKMLGENKIKEWHFTVPDCRSKDLLGHCVKKAEEYRNKDLAFLDPAFDILIMDLDHFSEQIPTALAQTSSRLELDCKTAVSDDAMVIWAASESTLVNNARRKHAARFNQISADNTKNVEKLTTATVKEFLEGTERLRTWEEVHQSRYERYQKLLDALAKNVEEKSMFVQQNSNQFLDEIRKDLQVRLEKEFPEIDTLSLHSLAEYAISKWLLECTLDIEGLNS